MKILCVADQIDPLVYSPNIRQRFSDVDLILSAGDLPPRYHGYMVSMLDKQLYFVLGNHDSPVTYRQHGSTLLQHLQEDSGGLCVGGKVIFDRQHKIIIAGMGGCKRYNHGDHQFTEWQMILRFLPLLPQLLLNRLIHGRYLDILLTHAPPAGIHDRRDPCHRGFKFFLWLLRVFKPRYMLHGHVHLFDLNERQESTYHQTRIINIYSRYLLEYDDYPYETHRVAAKLPQSIPP